MQALGSIIGAAAGGGAFNPAIAALAEGGEVVGPGGPRSDAIPAAMSDGEYVIPADVVHRKGTEHFDKLIQKTQAELAEKQQQAIPAAGGQVNPPLPALPPPNQGGY
jgi:hypothetical protein